MNNYHHQRPSFLEKIFPPSPYHKSNLPEPLRNTASFPAYNYVIWENKDKVLENGFHEEVREKLLNALRANVENGLTFWVRDNSIKSLTLRDESKSALKIIALIRIREQSESSAKETLGFLDKHFSTVSAYKVENSVPLDYTQTWPMGTQSPGLVSLSFFTARKGMSTEQFREYWFCSHTPFALDIHPLWKYERNVVLSSLQDDSPDFQAIVPLHVKSDKELAFSKFFSYNKRNPLFNALRINNDVKNFIDLKNIQTVAMREYPVC